MTNVLPSSSASDIISYVRSRCRLGTNPPNAALQQTQMLVALNDINEWFWYWPLDHGDMAPWKISRERKSYITVAETSLSSSVSANATVLPVASVSDLDNPAGSDVGAVYVRNNEGIYTIVPYDNQSGSTLTGCSGIDIAIAASASVFKMYPLPTNYGRPRQLKIDNMELKFCDNEFDDIPPPGKFLTHYLKSTSLYDRFFLTLPYNTQSGRVLRFNYVRRPTPITNSDGSDKVDAPDGVARWALIEKFKAYAWEQRGDTERSLKAAQEAESLIRQYAAVQTNEDASQNQDPTFDLD